MVVTLPTVEGSLFSPPSLSFIVHRLFDDGHSGQCEVTALCFSGSYCLFFSVVPNSPASLCSAPPSVRAVAAPLRRAPPRPSRGQPAERPASAGIRPPLRPHSASGPMAGSALRVAGRRLSQHTGSGAPVLLRQVRCGWTRERDYWVLSGCKGGTPGSFKSGEIPWPQSWIFEGRVWG